MNEPARSEGESFAAGPDGPHGTDRLTSAFEQARKAASSRARAMLHDVADRITAADEIAEEVAVAIHDLLRQSPTLAAADLDHLTLAITRRRVADFRRVGSRRQRFLGQHAVLPHEHDPGSTVFDAIAKLVSPGPTPSSIVGRREDARKILDEAALLPATQRDALLLYCVAGLNTSEIGDELGISRTSAANFVRRAIDGVRAGLRQRHPTTLREGSQSMDDLE